MPQPASPASVHNPPETVILWLPLGTEGLHWLYDLPTGKWTREEANRNPGSRLELLGQESLDPMYSVYNTGISHGLCRLFAPMRGIELEKNLLKHEALERGPSCLS